MENDEKDLNEREKIDVKLGIRYKMPESVEGFT